VALKVAEALTLLSAFGFNNCVAGKLLDSYHFRHSEGVALPDITGCRLRDSDWQLFQDHRQNTNRAVRISLTDREEDARDRDKLASVQRAHEFNRELF
jgi:hypothetical protein